MPRALLLPPRLLCALGLAVVLVVFFADAYFFDGPAVIVDVVVLGFALAGIAALSGEPVAWRRPDTRVVVAAVAGAVVGHTLTTRAGLHPVLAGSLAGTLASALPRAGLAVVGPWAAAFYVGAFAGTGATVILHGAPWVVLAGLLAGLLWGALPDAWAGVGGKMGFTALVGAGTAVLLSERFGGNHPPQLPMQRLDLAHAVAVPLATLSAVLTRRLVQRHGLSAVAASAVPTAAVASLLFLAEVGLAGPLTAAWFAGSFVGMTHPTRISSNAGVGIAAMLLGVVLLRLQSPMVGWAGVLGATACTCVLATIGAGAVAARVRAAR